MDVVEAKEIVRAEIDRLTPTLLEVSHSIHANPELNFEEHHAHDTLTGVLEDEGLSVERGAYDMATAFESRVGADDGPTVAVLCEYDALPGIGHACGHNIIGAAGLGAGLAAAKVAEVLNISYPVFAGGADIIAAMDAFGDQLGALPFSVLLAPDGRILMRKSDELQRAELVQLLEKHL